MQGALVGFALTNILTSSAKRMWVMGGLFLEILNLKSGIVCGSIKPFKVPSCFFSEKILERI
jgi:hypothetical protein